MNMIFACFIAVVAALVIILLFTFFILVKNQNKGLAKNYAAAQGNIFNVLAGKMHNEHLLETHLVSRGLVFTSAEGYQIQSKLSRQALLDVYGL